MDKLIEINIETKINTKPVFNHKIPIFLNVLIFISVNRKRKKNCFIRNV